MTSARDAAAKPARIALAMAAALHGRHEGRAHGIADERAIDGNENPVPLAVKPFIIVVNARPADGREPADGVGMDEAGRDFLGAPVAIGDEPTDGHWQASIRAAM